MAIYHIQIAIKNTLSHGNTPNFTTGISGRTVVNADELHPNASGGIALYNQFISDLGWIKPNA